MPKEIIVTSRGPIRLSDKAAEFMNTPAVFPVIEDIYSISDKRAWVVVCTDFAQEAKAEEKLQEAKVSTFLPLERAYVRKEVLTTKMVAGIVQRRRTRTIRRPVERPLLPGYLFVELPATCRKVARKDSNGRDTGKTYERWDISKDAAARVAHIEGVTSIIGQDHKPFPVPVEFVDFLKKEQRIGTFDRTNARPSWAQKGCEVRIADGPFASFLAIVEKHLPNDMLQVAVSIFGRSTPVKLEMSQVDKVR